MNKQNNSIILYPGKLLGQRAEAVWLETSRNNFRPQPRSQTLNSNRGPWRSSCCLPANLLCNGPPSTGGRLVSIAPFKASRAVVESLAERCDRFALSGREKVEVFAPRTLLTAAASMWCKLREIVRAMSGVRSSPILVREGRGEGPVARNFAQQTRQDVRARGGPRARRPAGVLGTPAAKIKGSGVLRKPVLGQATA